MSKIDKNRRDFKRRCTTYFNGFNMRCGVLFGWVCLNKALHRLLGQGSKCQNTDVRYMVYNK